MSILHEMSAVGWISKKSEQQAMAITYNILTH